jgi:hypothetical protein
VVCCVENKNDGLNFYEGRYDIIDDGKLIDIAVWPTLVTVTSLMSAHIARNYTNKVPSLWQTMLATSLPTAACTLNVFCLSLPQSKFSTPNFRQFGPLKKTLRGNRFPDPDELKCSMREELRRFSKAFLYDRHRVLAESWKKEIVENKPDILKDVTMIYVKLITIVTVVSEKNMSHY